MPFRRSQGLWAGQLVVAARPGSAHNRSMHRLLAVVLAVGFAVVAPAVASGATRFVANGGLDNTDCTNAGAPCATADHAAEVAANGDTIQIAAGVYDETVETDKVLTFVGAGGGTLDGIPAATVVRGPAGGGTDGHPAFVLPNGGELRSLRAEGGKGANQALTTGEAGGEAIVYDSNAPGQSALRLDHVVAVGGDAGFGKTPELYERGPGGRGIEVDSGPGDVALSAVDCEFAGGAGLGHGDAIAVDGPGASADVVRSSMKAEGSLLGTGIIGFSGARLSLESVEIASEQTTGALIYEGSMTIRRSRVLGEYGVMAVGSGGTSSTAEVFDSLLISTGGPAAESEAYDDESTSSLTVVGSTIVGLESYAAVRSTHEAESGSATVTMRNSIARNLPAPTVPARDLLANGGTIDATFSSFTSIVEENGGSASAPGSASNLTGDPLFVDPSKGNFALQSGSPLIDRGEPALVAAGQLDLAGSPRSVDGNLDCVAAPDIGAFEVTGQSASCPDPFPAITKFAMTNRVFAPKGGKRPRRGSARAAARRKAVKRGTKFTYTLSEPARVKIRIERRKPGGRGKKRRFSKVTTISQLKKSGRGATKFSGRARGRPLKPGKYRAKITATDSAGQTSAPKTLGFRIVAS
jgi:hypothetical protein